MNKELNQYINRFSEQLKKLNLKTFENESLTELINSRKADLNNLFMAGMGASTLFLRLGAVYLLVRKLKQGNIQDDAILTKQIVENLHDILPSDTNWKIIWEICASEESNLWVSPIAKEKGEQQNLLEKFITFRNKYVHGAILLDELHINDLVKGLNVMNELISVHGNLFNEFNLYLKEDSYYLSYNKEEFCLHPFIQKGESDTPYIFQGLYQNKSIPELIGVEFGDVVKQDNKEAYAEVFDPLTKTLRNGTGQLFLHTDRMKYYLDCFVGREREIDAILNWINTETDKNVLPIYSEAGMGKGALTAGVIDQLLNDSIPVMYHFCGSGLANSLQSVLYHFILQGKNMPGMNGAGIWKVKDELLKNKMDRLPSRYFDAIKLFQSLLQNCYSPSQKYKDKPLVIIIDGLDEAAVINSQLKITDWFYTYNDKDEIESHWISPPSIKWIFTYRFLPEKEKQGFQLGGRFGLEENSLVQPLQGLTDTAVREALKQFEVSEEFVQAVLEKGAVDMKVSEVCSH